MTAVSDLSEREQAVWKVLVSARDNHDAVNLGTFPAIAKDIITALHLGGFLRLGDTDFMARIEKVKQSNGLVVMLDYGGGECGSDPDDQPTKGAIQ